jgi:imidazolonepropionase-like amidohydrolase
MGTHQVSKRPLLIEHITVVDTGTTAIAPDRDVLIRDGAISRIAQSGALADGLDAEIIDGRGRFLSPGLIDMHVHYRDWVAELFLNHGVTSVRDNGNQLTWILSLKLASDAGWLDLTGPRWFSRSGPRIFVSGIINTPPYGRPHHVPVTTRREANDAVDFMAAAGVDGFKLHAGTTAAVAAAVCDRAHQYGLRVTTHLDVRRLSITAALDAGVDCIEHTTAFVDVPKRKALQIVRRMADQGVWWCPTVAMPKYGWLDVIGVKADDAAHVLRLLAEPALASYVPIDQLTVQRETYRQGGVAPSTDNLRRTLMSQIAELIAQFVTSGGRLLVGSDTAFATLPGLSLHQEMDALVAEFGATPSDVLAGATHAAAAYLGKSTLGRVQEGMTADLLILSRNPSNDIRAARSIEHVIKDGQVLQPGYHEDFVALLPRAALP